jgi:oligopeptide transport system permease protein
MDMNPAALLLPGGVLVAIIACLTIAGERFRDRLAGLVR